MSIQYAVHAETLCIDGFAKDIFTAKQDIRRRMSGHRFDWRTEVTLIDTETGKVLQ